MCIGYINCVLWFKPFIIYLICFSQVAISEFSICATIITVDCLENDNIFLGTQIIIIFFIKTRTRGWTVLAFLDCKSFSTTSLVTASAKKYRLKTQ